VITFQKWFTDLLSMLSSARSYRWSSVLCENLCHMILIVYIYSSLIFHVKKTVSSKRYFVILCKIVLQMNKNVIFKLLLTWSLGYFLSWIFVEEKFNRLRDSNFLVLLTLHFFSTKCLYHLNRSKEKRGQPIFSRQVLLSCYYLGKALFKDSAFI
jgi:hypothetical protein